MKNLLLILYVTLMLSAGCEDFVTVSLPDSQIGTEEVFNNDRTAIAAANGMYRSLGGSLGFLNSTLNNVNYFAAMSSDEVISYSTNDALREFYFNNLNINNTNVLRIWSSAYNTLYEANAVLEGATQSEGLSDSVRTQLMGEARFVRAFSHFYLVNIFGDVPLVTTTDYRVNARLTRTDVAIVYEHIIDDLLEANNLFSQLTLTDRTRPGKSAVAALLARVYLYTGNNEAAEVQASEVIADATLVLEEPINAFLTGSREAIWQLAQVTPSSMPTGDAGVFVIFNNSVVNALRMDLVQAFEPADKRSTAWLRTWTAPSGTYYYAAKYKIRNSPSTTVFTERLAVLRLAEQYLIRAEARAREGDLAGAISDLDVVRARAGLPLIAAIDPGIQQPALLLRIEHERRIELFCEGGHRWLDLKRTGRADAVLSLVKANWTEDDVLYPIPETELLANPFLGLQNPGY